ncbi:MAG: hypothetical protein V2I82_02960 [Halieaceae bacterium]|jgi:addiction module HigA family antidote|nr:hypothetical protein [Halieaceae bacterium]
MAVPHPGSLIEPLLLEPSGISQSELARRLGFNQPQPVNELIKGKRGFTPKMALLFDRVSQGAFPTVFWLTAQALYDAQSASESVSAGRRSAVNPLRHGRDPGELAQAADCERLFELTCALDALVEEK